jgi:uncharacterized protein YcbX
MSVVGSISEIYLYPIKSCSGIKLNKATITKLGLAHPENENVIDR